MDALKKIQEAAAFIADQGIEAPQVGIVLGTGLGNLTRSITVIKELNYADIPHFPEATVEFHAGKLIYGTIAGVRVLAMKGRFHAYEGYAMEEIVLPVRVMKLLGVEKLLLSNAAGCMNLSWKKGDLMLIHDHINLQNGNPLIGKNMDSLGPRFPDMSKAYAPAINDALEQIAAQHRITLRKGVYVSVPGPMLETPAEYRFLRIIGADAVGMSTVPEVIAANHMGLPCAAISVLTDECDPDNLQPVNIEDIIRIANEADERLSTLFVALIEKWK